MKKFVWYKRKIWLNDRPVLKDNTGRIALTDIKDHSKGILALPENVRNCTNEEINDIEYSLSRIQIKY